jgi:hypothetical protein
VSETVDVTARETPVKHLSQVGFERLRGSLVRDKLVGIRRIRASDARTEGYEHSRDSGTN